MNFNPERLKKLRTSLGINKAEAARKLNLSAMGYGRYESGEREPSFQTVSFIAHTFGTTTDYLYGISDTPEITSTTLNQSENPLAFEIMLHLKKEDDMSDRLLAYYKSICNNK